VAKPNISFSVRVNGIGMAPKHYDVVYHVCRQVSAHVLSTSPIGSKTN